MLNRGALSILALLVAPLTAQEGADREWSYRVQDTYQPSDYLPLSVGNSWTFLHDYRDAHAALQDTEQSFPRWEASDTRQFTISVLRTEVIDGETYYVFSDPPADGWPPMPAYFIGGKKLRWDGNALIVHDGTTEVLRYEFRVLTQGQPHEQYTYTVPRSRGAVSITGISSASRAADIPRQQYSHWEASLIEFNDLSFFGGFGIEACSNRRISGDHIYFGNSLQAVEAMLYEESTRNSEAGGEPPSSESRTARRITYADAFKSWLRGRRGTSTDSSSWGQLRNR